MLPKQFFLKLEVFQNSPKVTIHLGNFCNKKFTQNFEKSPNLVTLGSTNVFVLSQTGGNFETIYCFV